MKGLRLPVLLECALMELAERRGQSEEDLLASLLKKAVLDELAAEAAAATSGRPEAQTEVRNA